MNPTPRSIYRAAALPVSLLSLIALSAQSASADTYDWTGATSTTWSTASNYSLGGVTSGVVPGSADIVRFNASTYTNSPNLTGAATVGQLLFDSTNTGGTSFGSGSNTLTLSGVGGVGMQINAGSGLVDTGFNLTLRLGADQTWLNNSALATGFQSNGTISLNGFTLTVDGSGLTSFNPSSGSVSGNGSIIKTGSGTLVLAKANTYVGSTTVSGGTLRLGAAAALGNSANTVTVQSGGTLDLRGQTVTNAYALSINGAGYNAGGAIANSSGTAASYAGLVTLAGDSSIIAGTGAITLGNTGVITGSGYNLTVGGASNTTIAGVIGTGSGALVKQDTGTLTLSGANTYTGATKINGGTLNLTGSLNSSSALEINGGALTYAPTVGGSTQTFNGTTVKTGGATINNATAGNTVNLGALTRESGGVLNISSLVGSTTTSTAVDATGILGTWATTGSGTSLTYAGGGGGGAITAYSGGTAAATAANVTDTAGVTNYNVAAVGALGAGASFNTLRYTGAAGTITGSFMANGLMNAGTGTLTLSGGVTIGSNKELVITGNTQSITLSGVIADNSGGASGLTYNGTSAAVLTLSGSNTYTGTTTINSGILRVANSNAVQGNIVLGSANATVNADSTSVTIASNISGLGKITKSNGGSILTLTGTNSHTGGTTLTDGRIILGNNSVLGTGLFTLTGGAIQSSDNTSRTFSNTLSMGSSALSFGAAQGAVTGLGDLNFTSTVSTAVGGAKTWTVTNNTTTTFANDWTGNAGHNITKAGTGTLVFNGNIATSNAINVVVSAGTMALNGANNITSGTMTVNGGTLLVNGATNGTGAVTVNSTGTLGGAGTIAGATTAASGSFLSAGSGVGAAGTMTFKGTLDISGLAGGTGGLLFDLGAVGASDKIALSSGALTIGTGVLDWGDFSFSALSGFGEGTYTLFSSTTSIVGTMGTNLTGTIAGYDAVLSMVGNNIVLTVSSVPEPSSYALLAGGILLGFATLRRGRRD